MEESLNMSLFVVRGGSRNPVLIVELKRASKWTRAEVTDDLTYIEGRFDSSIYNTVYGLGGIGLHWMVCRMEKSGPDSLEAVEEWQDDITSDASYGRFSGIADLVYNIS